MASVLQKTIRRGLEEETMYWAIEMESRFPEYLWKRFQVISIEDIGIADREAVLYVAEMRRLYQELKKDYDKEPNWRGRSFRMALANAILTLWRAKKCRIGDEFQIAMYGRIEREFTMEIPDYALDQHTGTGDRWAGVRSTSGLRGWFFRTRRMSRIPTARRPSGIEREKMINVAAHVCIRVTA